MRRSIALLVLASSFAAMPASSQGRIDPESAFLCSTARAVFYDIESDRMRDWTDAPSEIVVFIGSDGNDRWLNLMSFGPDFKDTSFPFYKYYGEEPMWSNANSGQVIFDGGQFLTVVGLGAHRNGEEFGSFTIAATCVDTM